MKLASVSHVILTQVGRFFKGLILLWPWLGYLVDCFMSMQEMQENPEEQQQSYFALLGFSGAQILWHVGFIAVPVALFLVGTAQYDLLHAPYLVLLLVYMAWPALRLKPSPTSVILPFRQVCSLCHTTFWLCTLPIQYGFMTYCQQSAPFVPLMTAHLLLVHVISIQTTS